MLHRVDLSLQVDGLARPYKVPFSFLPAPKAMALAAFPKRATATRTEEASTESVSGT